MAMKRCPECGEKYSDTYKYCPFCEEEDSIRQGNQIRRGSGRGGKRATRRSQPSLLSPILIVVILLLAALLVYLLFGDRIAERLGGGEEPVTPPVENTDPVEPDPGGTEPDPDVDDGVVMPSDPDVTDEPPVSTGMTYEKAAALPAGLTLSSTDFSLFTAGETSTLRVSGGTGTYEWFSEDEGVASVDSSGKVIAISKGDIKIVVTDGQKQGTCIVRVKVPASSAAAPAATGGDNGSGGSHRLNNTDFTRKVSEGPYQLKVSGVTTAITWTSSNTSVATVSETGVVTPVAVGTATVTASWDGQSLECIVRVV